MTDQGPARLGQVPSFLCSRCRRIYEQGGPGLRKKEARFRAMRAQWTTEAKAFLCHFTALPLTELSGQPLVCDLELLTLGDQWSVVLAADLVSKMKGHMTEAQFRRMVVALARNHFQTNEPFDREAFQVEASPFDATDDSELDTPFATP